MSGAADAMNNALLFVYGTLRAGGSNDIARIAPAARHFAAARVRGLLYDLGAYPALQLDASAGWVAGELYAVPAHAWPALDALEEPVTAERPNGDYFKLEAEVELADDSRRVVWIYAANPAVLKLDHPIAGGDWMAYAAANRK
ncbi:MAG: AIG2-like family protein [Betaproteobacteria bacterium]|nr:AIG2-like family protein [Betaproteobacteria bacterium]